LLPKQHPPTLQKSFTHKHFATKNIDTKNHLFFATTLAKYLSATKIAVAFIARPFSLHITRLQQNESSLCKYQPQQQASLHKKKGLTSLSVLLYFM